jgi:AcrR family transcriptional regulator
MTEEVRDRHFARRDRKERGPETDQEEPGRRTGDETWDLLLRVSAEAFAASSYSGASLQGIAEAVGLLKGSLYYYIHSKEDLLYEIVRDVLQRAIQTMEPIAEEPGTGLERLARVAEAHVRHLVTHLAATAVVVNDLRRLSPERREQLPEKQFYAVYERVISAGLADGSINSALSPIMVRRLVLGLANSVVTWYGSVKDKDADEVATDIATVIRGGFAPLSAAAAASDGRSRPASRPSPRSPRSRSATGSTGA